MEEPGTAVTALEPANPKSNDVTASAATKPAAMYGANPFMTPPNKVSLTLLIGELSGTKNSDNALTGLYGGAGK